LANNHPGEVPNVIVIFQDRRHAGLALGQIVRDECADYLGSDAIVLGLPRGGVPVAFEVARELHLPLDVFVVRKLGVPGQEELALGAVASGGVIVLQNDVISRYQIGQETIDAVVARERFEMERRESAFREGRPPLTLEDRIVILVDDGLATGATMKAAVRAVRPLARRILVAVPVAAFSTCEELRQEVDRMVCIECPESFHAVGEFYRNFEQISDEEVRSLLAQAREGAPGTDAGNRTLS
jgi:predicted phosphoribosyltransferase